MSCPDWQYPHCGTCSAIHACCKTWLRSGDKPSIVVIFCPAAADTGSEHERTGAPFRCTVQAPHCAIPHPNLVPVIFNSSRKTHKSGVSGSTSSLRACLLIVRVNCAMMKKQKSEERRETAIVWNECGKYNIRKNTRKRRNATSRFTAYSSSSSGSYSTSKNSPVSRSLAKAEPSSAPSNGMIAGS